MPDLFDSLAMARELWNRPTIRRHSRDSRDQAQRWGWQFAAELPDLTRDWPMNPFVLGRSRRSQTVSTGRYDGLAMRTFRHRQRPMGAEHGIWERFAVAVVRLPADLPGIQLNPGRTLQALTFESLAFDRAWSVNSPQPRFAHDLIHPRMMERLLAPELAKHYLAQFGRDLIVVRPGIHGPEADLPLLGLLSDLVALVPRFVWQQAGVVPPVRSHDGPQGT